jgi:protein-tyrosine phosphatase
MITQLTKLTRGDRYGWVFGGPYREIAALQDLEVSTARICLAREINESATCKVPTQDFDTPPSEQVMKYALVVAVQAIADGYDVYAGCMGGVGRTGTFFALLVAALRPKTKDPVAHVRANYNSHAVETSKQHMWVMGFIRRNRVFFEQLRKTLRGPQAKRRARRRRGKTNTQHRRQTGAKLLHRAA